MGRARAGNLLLTTSQTGIGFSGSAGLRNAKEPGWPGSFAVLARCGRTDQLNLKGFRRGDFVKTIPGA
jgi:hypothetical protein